MIRARNLERWDGPIDALETWDRTPDIEAEYAVASESNDEKAYLVRRIDALDTAFEDADVTADSRDVWICSCGQFQYRCWPDEPPQSLDAIPDCKHCRAVSREVRARADDSQQTLATPVGDK